MFLQTPRSLFPVSWILIKQEMMGWQWHQLNHMQTRVIEYIILESWRAYSANARWCVAVLASSWDLSASLGHPSKFQLVLHLGSVTARHSSSGRQPKFAALNRGRHLHLAVRPSLWALAHILVCFCFASATMCWCGRQLTPWTVSKKAHFWKW